MCYYTGIDLLGVCESVCETETQKNMNGDLVMKMIISRVNTTLCFPHRSSVTFSIYRNRLNRLV